MLDNVSVDIPRGSVVCVVDIGGASRTPLLRIVAKMIPPKAGEVVLRGRVVSLGQLGAIPMPYRTMRQNLVTLGKLLGLGRQEILSSLPAMEAFTGKPELFDMPMRRVPKAEMFEIALSLMCSSPIEIVVAEDFRKIGSKGMYRFMA